MIRPRGGIFNSYSQGTGLKEDDSPFDMLEVYNNNPLSVGISLFVGWGDYIDNRLIPINSLIQQVTYPTYDANAAPLNNVAIPDLSGQYISDANGVLRIALQRVALQIFNIDTGQAILLLNNALTVNVANVPPLTGITLPTAGNFRIKPPVATVNGIVSEIYSAILPSQIQSS
jgi:hypothetical protein